MIISATPLRLSRFVALTALLVIMAGCGCLPCSSSSSSSPDTPPEPSYLNMAPMAPPKPQWEVPQSLTNLRTQAWRPGYWQYDNGTFTWIPGTIIEKPTFTAVWSPDRWVHHTYGWAFVHGYWQ